MGGERGGDRWGGVRLRSGSLDFLRTGELSSRRALRAGERERERERDRDGDRERGLVPIEWLPSLTFLGGGERLRGRGDALPRYGEIGLLRGGDIDDRR